jgi:hypothetical protein
VLGTNSLLRIFVSFGLKSFITLAQSLPTKIEQAGQVWQGQNALAYLAFLSVMKTFFFLYQLLTVLA